MASPKKLRKALTAARAQNRALRACNPQTRLRRFIGDSVQNGTAYASSRGYTSLMRKGLAPDFPVDGVAGILAQLAGSLRVLGPISDVARELGGGAAGGAMGRLAAFHALGVKKNAAGEFILEPPTE